MLHLPNSITIMNASICMLHIIDIITKLHKYHYIYMHNVAIPLRMLQYH